MSKKILIVDDSRVDVSVLLKILDQRYAIEVADSGEAALEMVATFQPDLILLDIILPGISGFEVCRMIAGNSLYADIPIIMITGRTHENDMREGLDAGAIDYIKKPFSGMELTSRVRAVLRLRHYITMLKQTNQEKQLLINELKEAMGRIKTLSALLPICASCKRVRDDKGYWEQVDHYILKHSDIQFSHGLCPECVTKLYPTLTIKGKKEK